MILIKVGKLSFKLAIIFLSVIVIASFFDLKKARAEENPTHNVVINEIMWPGADFDTTDEWLELRNMTSDEIDFSLTPWSIYKNDSLMILINQGKISANGYFLIARKNSDNSILQITPDFIPSSSFSLNNNAVQYKLYNYSDNSGDLIDVADDGVGSPLAGSNAAPKASMERNYNPGDGTAKESWHTALSSVGFDLGADEKGTPGSENSTTPIILPQLDSPQNGAVFVGDANFNFEWDEEDGLNYQLKVSENDDLSNPISDLSNLSFGKYYWGVEVSNDKESKLSEIWSFELKDYPETVVINEVCPHPNGGTDNEFIELYNKGNEVVDLSGWFLDDIDGGSKPYEIPQNTIIGPKKYLAFYRSLTGIVLNDNGDSARLLYPNGNVAYSISYSAYATLGYSWAKKPNASWTWTTTPTFGAVNRITLPATEENIEESQPINTVPIEIPTGNYEDYLDKLVRVTGKVTSTSGNTFYLDDGSGSVKIYIQEKTGINKPEMHKNDIFEITGVVDLYGKTWRILPQKQSDVKLVELAPKVVKTASAKASTKSSASTTKKSSSLNSPKETLGVTDTNQGSNSSQNQKKTSFWTQLLKAAIGLAIILLAVLILKIMRRPKPKTIGGHFGDDET